MKRETLDELRQRAERTDRYRLAEMLERMDKAEGRVFYPGHECRGHAELATEYVSRFAALRGIYA